MSNAMSSDLLFVYGTLRRAAAHPMHGLLKPASFVDFGEFQGRLYDLGMYPGAVVSDDPADIVQGEIYRLHDPPAILARLDQYEGCGATDRAPTEYRRVLTRVRLANGGSVQAHIYLYQRALDKLPRIESGDYLH